MSGYRMSGILATLIAAILAVSVMAQAKIEQKVTFHIDGKVGTEMIKKGSYLLVIPEGSEGNLEIKVGKKVISVPCSKQATSEESATDKVTYRANSDGTHGVATIAPRGQKFTIVLAEKSSG